jgi:hypothetical protein
MFISAYEFERWPRPVLYTSYKDRSAAISITWTAGGATLMTSEAGQNEKHEQILK